MSDSKLFCTFRANGLLFGVDMLDVKEVTTQTRSTNVPHTPDEVTGLVNIRGQIYLALDIRRLLGMEAAELTADSRLILFKPSVGSAFGILVDEVAGIHQADSEEIDELAIAANADITSSVRRVDLIESLCKLPTELLVVLNPRKFLGIVEKNFV
jgi:purine-binding chemotaxis protein CheW